MYDVKKPEQGGLLRYVVLLRVNPALDQWPSTDQYTTHVVWADDPYDAAATAEILAKQMRGQFTRRVIGVEECPIEPLPESEASA